MKAWFDAVAQKGKTWTVGESGYEGLMQEREALVLMTSDEADSRGLQPLARIAAVPSSRSLNVPAMA